MNITIKYGKFDPEAKADSTATTTDIKPWADISDLTIDRVMPPNGMTMERNYIPLDGTMGFFPSDPSQHDWGWFSESMSNADCLYATPPTVTITFTQDHKSPGITLRFYPYTNDYAREVRCTWYDSADNVLEADTFLFDSNTGIIRQDVTAYRKIKIEIIRSSLPYRYVKLYAIEYGIEETMTDIDIDKANIVEEIDPISDTLSVNTLGFNVKMKNPVFSLISGNTADNMLMKKQMMTVTANGEPFGTFFLDTWKDDTGRGIAFSFSANDAVGVMDGYQFMGGLYDNAPIRTVLDAIFAVSFPTGLIVYELDDDLAGATLTGYIPICSCREALQMICFAIGAIADDSRRDYIWIYGRDIEPTYTIPREEQYLKVTLEPTDYYSGVDIAAYTYTESTEISTPQDGILPAGQHRIAFSQPLRTLTATGATIIESGVNFAVLNVVSQQNVKLTGLVYRANSTVYSVRSTVEPGEVESIAVFEGNTLVNNGNAQTLANSIFQYLQYRVQMNPEIRLQGREVGYVTEIPTYQKPIVGIIESLNVNLRGNRAPARIVGNVVD